ncbi:MAG: hypothetical protein AAGC88_04535 [Bacteroidota bacterium]
MKTLFTSTLLAAIFILSHFAVAQTPKDGAIIKLDQTALTVESGADATVSIQIVRSKRFQKSKIGLPVVGSSVDGLSYDIAVADEADRYLLTIRAEEGVAPATHTLVIKGDPKWGRKIRSSLLSVEIVNAGSAVSAKR